MTQRGRPGHAGSSRATNASSRSTSAGARSGARSGRNGRGIVGRAHRARQPVLTGRHRRHERRHDGVRPHDVGVGTQRAHRGVTRRTIVTPKVDDASSHPTATSRRHGRARDLGRRRCEAFRLPGEREAGLGQRRARDRSRCGGRARATAHRRSSAVSTRTPGMGDHRVQRHAVGDLAEHHAVAHAADAGGRVGHRQHRVGGAESVHGEVAAEAEPARVRELVVLRLGSARRTTNPAAAPSARPPGRRRGRAPCRECAA